MRFVTRAACAILLAFGVCVSSGCGDDGTEPAPHPSSGWKYVWAKRFGDATPQFARTVAADASGNVIVAGYFYGTVDFGGGALTSPGGYNIYLAKFNSSGAHVWSKNFGDASEQVVQGVAVDASGNVFIAGYFEGAVDFGGGTLTSAGLRDVFVAKFTSGGSYVWAKRFGDATYQQASALALDSSGNIIMAGMFLGTLDLGGGALTGAGGWDIFMAKLDSDGNHLWSHKFGDGNNQYATAVAVDGADNMIVAGYFNGNVDFGGGTLTSAGAEDVYAAKFNAGGGHVWSKRFGDASTDQEAWGVAVDGSDNVIIAGHFTGGVDFGGGALSTGGMPDIFVAKLNADGNHVWSKHYGDSYDQAASAVAVDPSDNILLTGSFNQNVDFGGGALSSGGVKDVFLAKLSTDGAHIWSKGFGDAQYQEGLAIASDASGNAIIGGYFAGSVNFGGGVLTSAGNEDLFVAKFGK